MKTVELTLAGSGDQVVIHAEGLTIVVKRQDEGISVYTQDSEDQCIKEDWTLFSEDYVDEDDGNEENEPLPDELLAKVIESRSSDVPSGVISEVMARHNLSDEIWETMPPGQQNQLFARHLTDGRR
jgi:hypothetical protein